MTDPALDDTTLTDRLVTPTGNGVQPDDPRDQPPQHRDWLPEGTAREGAE